MFPTGFILSLIVTYFIAHMGIHGYTFYITTIQLYDKVILIKQCCMINVTLSFLNTYYTKKTANAVFFYYPTMSR